jgi:hypothetical protein
MACLWLRLERSRGAGVFGRVLKYADLPKVRAWRAGAQLDIAAVFAVWKSEPALSVLFSELSTRQEARAVPASGLCVPCVFTAHCDQPRPVNKYAARLLYRKRRELR